MISSLSCTLLSRFRLRRAARTWEGRVGVCAQVVLTLAVVNMQPCSGLGLTELVPSTMISMSCNRPEQAPLKTKATPKPPHPLLHVQHFGVHRLADARGVELPHLLQRVLGGPALAAALGWGV